MRCMSAACACVRVALSCGSMWPLVGAYLLSTLVLATGALALRGVCANDNSPKIRHRSANVKSTKTMIYPLKNLT